MDSFAPFVPLLPYAVQGIWDSEQQLNGVSMKCPPPKKWQLFDMYAYRVRHIHPRPDCVKDIALYQELASIRTGVYLFPRLSTLQCHLCDRLAPGIELFPLSLRSLSLHLEYPHGFDDHALKLALRRVAHDTPYLEELYIFSMCQLRKESELHPDPLYFKRLHTVHLNVPMHCFADLESVAHLLSTSPVRNLRISTRPFILRDICISPDAFPCVENIYIFDRPEGATDIISRIRLPHLKSVTINEQDPATSIEGYARSFTLLAQRHPPISSLEIMAHCVYINTPNEFIRKFLAALEPLVRAGLTRLRVEMSVYSAWVIKEDVKARLRPEAWPSLTNFEFVFT